MTNARNDTPDDTTPEFSAARHLRELRATAHELRRTGTGLSETLATQLTSHATTLVESRIAYTRAAAALYLAGWSR